MLKVLFFLIVNFIPANDFFGGLEGIPKAENSLESRVNDRIQYAVMENNRGAHFSALQSLRAAVNETKFKSAKARYFLARQYQMMDANGLQSRNGQSFAEGMKVQLEQSSKLGDTNLDSFPSNAIYAKKSLARLNQMNLDR